MATIDNLSIQITANAEAAIAAINRTASSAERLRGAAISAGGGMRDLAAGARDAGTATQGAGEKTEKTRKSLHGFWNTLKQSGSYLGGAFLGGMKGVVGALGSMASGLLRIAKFRIYRTIIKDLGKSFKDLYGWSRMFGTDFYKSMDTINTSFVYLRNSIAAMVAPLVNALAPALDYVIDKVVEVLNWFNQLFSALSGASTYTVAKKVEQAWVGASLNAASNAKKASDEIKRTILGFDEINKLSKESSGGGGGGSSPYTTGYQYMFEEKELAGGWKDFATAIENAMSDAFSRITMIVGGAELALGAILALSGANVPLGLGLMATGAVTLGSAIFANWEGINNEVKLAVAGVEAALGTGMMAVGAVLAFSGANIGLGIGLMIAGMSLGVSAVTIAWNTIGDKMSDKVQAIATLVGGASFGIGAVLAFSGHPGIGIAMMIAGASVTAVSINWNYLKEKLEGPLGETVALISGASLVLGILALLGGAIPIGLALILAGTAGLTTVAAANWDSLKEIGETAIEKVQEGWETIKELAVTAWVSLKKKVGEWATDVWNFLKDTGEKIAKTVEAAFTTIGTWAGDAWDAIKEGASTIGKTVEAAFTTIGSWLSPAWDAIKEGASTVGKTVEAAFKTVGSWVSDAWDAIKEGASTVGKTVEAAFKTVGSWVSDAWDAIKVGAEVISKTIEAGVQKAATWVSEAWEAAKMTGATVYRTIKQSLDKGATWVAEAWEAAKTAGATIYRTIRSQVDKGATWVAEAWEAAKTVGATVYRTIRSQVNTGATWVAEAWEAAKLAGATVYRTIKQSLDKGATWVAEAWEGAKLKAATVFRSIKQSVDKGKTWVADAWTGAKLKAATVFRSIKQSVDKGKTWVADAWTASKEKAATVLRTIKQSLEKGSKWSDDIWSFINGPVTKAVDVIVNFSLGVGKAIAHFLGINTAEEVNQNNYQDSLGLSYAQQWADAHGIDVPVNLTGTWSDSTGGVAGALGLTNVTATVKTLSPGWSGTAQSALGLDNVKVKVGLEMDSKSNEIEIKPVTGGSGGGGTWKAMTKAIGGIFQGGIWSSIPQYAGGTTNAHGSLFLAGEAGPEIVGHVGGRTEVLNKSQLAAAMYSAVHSAIAGVTLDANFYGGNADGEMNGETFAEMMEYMRADSDEMRKQNDLLRQQNDLLRQISEKEMSVSTAAINRAQAYMNRRAGTTVVPVGT